MKSYNTQGQALNSVIHPKVLADLFFKPIFWKILQVAISLSLSLSPSLPQKTNMPSLPTALIFFLTTVCSENPLLANEMKQLAPLGLSYYHYYHLTFISAHSMLDTITYSSKELAV